MKKYIAAPIGSALIVPGFGQVLNGHTKKGLIHMGAVFILFIAGLIKLIPIVLTLVSELDPYEMGVAEFFSQAEKIHDKIYAMDIIIMKIIIIAFLAVWIYSIIDAFIYGLKIEIKRNKKSEKLLP